MKRTFLIIMMLGLTSLTACAKKELGAPCSNFGTYCKQYPVNSWDYKH